MNNGLVATHKTSIVTIGVERGTEHIVFWYSL